MMLKYVIYGMMMPIVSRLGKYVDIRSAIGIGKAILVNWNIG